MFQEINVKTRQPKIGENSCDLFFKILTKERIKLEIMIVGEYCALYCLHRSIP